ncbi:hypothetical protein MMC13_005701 [Lambiella insularis]|nr:hypothetical protein [Lambiella insularis]
MAMYAAYIETETSTQNADTFDVPKVSRRAETIMLDDPAAVYEVPPELDGKAPLNNIFAEPSQTLIAHEGITEVYKPSHALDKKILKKLEILTNCTISVHEGTEDIIVKGDKVEEVEKFCAKVAVIDAIYSRRTCEHTMFDHYMSENETSFKFRMQAPEKLIDRRLFHSIPSFQVEYVQITIDKWQGKTAEWQPRRVRVVGIQPGPNSSHPWSHYLFPSLGHEITRDESTSIDNHGSLAPDQIDTLTAWTEKVPIRPADAFGAPATDTTMIDMPPPKLPDPKEYIKSRRIIRGQPQIDTKRFETLPQPPPIREPYMPITPAKPTDISAPIVSTKAQANSLTNVPVYRPGPLIDHPEPVGFVSQRPSPMKPEPRRVHAQKTIQQTDKKLLQDIAQPEENPEAVIDSLKRGEDFQSRQYERGARLKASKTATSTSEGRSVISKVTEAMTTILELARPSCARLTLEIVFGCVYIRRSDLAKDIQSRHFGEEEWSFALRTRNGTGKAPTTFSKTLTTSWADANFVLDLKLPFDVRMVSPTPISYRVSYVINCVNTYHKRAVTIEMEQDGKHSLYSSREVIGSINCHFVKRTWDFAVNLTEDTMAAVDPQDPIHSVIKDFWVRGGPRCDLGSRVSSPDIQITSVQVRRQVSHSSTANPDLLLHLTEVQDLVLQRSSQQFRAYAASEEDMTKDDNRVWWEASVSSTVADKVLKENETLELGNVASWLPSDIVGMSILADMFHLAQQIVTRIDSVGHSTIGLCSLQPLPSSRHSATKSSQTSKHDRFASEWSEW